MTTLIAYGLDMSITGSITEHTYVATSGRSDTWSCHGRSEGGREILQVYGDLEKAKKLASWSTNGYMPYALAGVCHQNANRILRATRKTVSDAKGYKATWALYGAYGTRGAAWYAIWLDACKDVFGWGMGGRDPLYSPRNPTVGEVDKKLFDKKISADEAEKMVNEIEFSQLFVNDDDSQIFDTSTSASLLNQISEMRSETATNLEHNIAAGSISVDQIMKVNHDNLQVVMKAFSNNMPEDQFKNMFDHASNTELQIIDPKVVADLMAKGAYQPAN